MKKMRMNNLVFLINDKEGFLKCLLVLCSFCVVLVVFFMFVFFFDFLELDIYLALIIYLNYSI